GNSGSIVCCCLLRRLCFLARSRAHFSAVATKYFRLRLLRRRRKYDREVAFGEAGRIGAHLFAPYLLRNLEKWKGILDVGPLVSRFVAVIAELQDRRAQPRDIDELIAIRAVLVLLINRVLAVL